MFPDGPGCGYDSPRRAGGTGLAIESATQIENDDEGEHTKYDQAGADNDVELVGIEKSIEHTHVRSWEVSRVVGHAKTPRV
jgi:hypothetical protein